MNPLQIIKKKRAEAINRIISHGYLAPYRVYVGMATCEIAAGSMEVMAVFQNALENGKVNFFLSQKGCAGRCNFEPTVEIVEEGKIPVKYCSVDAEKAKQIIERHLIGGEIITEWVFH